MYRIVVVLLVGLLCGCSVGIDGRPLEELAPDANASEDYVVQAGDSLSVQVWGEPEVSGEVFVRDDGKFTMPLINDVPAQGSTLTDVGSTVTEQLKRFIPGASVSVSVVQSAPIRYFLLGSFLKPGEYRSDGKITFLQAIASGGGFAPFADEGAITLIRKTPDGERRYQLSYSRVISGDQPNPLLKSGDVIAIK